MPTEVFPQLVDGPTLGNRKDPVANAARLSADHILAFVAAQPVGARAPALQYIARQLRPDGDKYISAQATSALRAGYAPDSSLRSAVTALIGNSYATMLMTGRVPAWMTGTSGLGFDFATIVTGLPASVRGLLTDTTKALICEPDAGKTIGKLIRADGEQAGAVGQAALQKVVGCTGNVNAGTLAFESEASFPWHYAAIGAGVLIVSVGGYFLLRKKGR